MPVDVIIGLQWGDEGKGKIVDILAPGYKIVARFQGGPNAGHTLVINNKKYVFHTLPSGVIHPELINILGSGMVVDPVILKEEIEKLYEENISLKGRLKLSANAHLIIPSHRLLDKYYEHLKGNKKIGSTLKGISPAYQDKYGRNGLKISDVFRKDFDKKYDELKQKHFQILTNFSGEEPGYEKKWFDSVEFMRSLEIIDTEYYINNELQKGTDILAEGAQGALLDINFGTYPFVTSSNTISSSACVGLGIPPQSIRNVYGVFKAYSTRVGEGPFLTEQINELGETLQKTGLEFGSTTGRPRRCGWLDLVALRYAIMINGVNHLVITKSDVLTDIGKIMICTDYLDSKGNQLTFNDSRMSDAVIPQYISLDSWKMDITRCNSFNNLPVEFRNYVGFIEKYLGLHISILSLGPDRSQTIIL